MKIKTYWPGKTIDPELISYRIEVLQKKLNPMICHAGFGIVFIFPDRVRHVHLLGAFLKFRNLNDVTFFMFDDKPWKKLTWFGFKEVDLPTGPLPEGWG